MSNLRQKFWDTAFHIACDKKLYHCTGPEGDACDNVPSKVYATTFSLAVESGTRGKSVCSPILLRS